MKQLKPKNDQRTLSQIKEHYVIEKSLAKKLLNANRNERRSLYSSVYDELFKRVPDHPQLVRKASKNERNETTINLLAILKQFLNPDSTFLEVGAGDCSLSFAVAQGVKKVYAVDVSSEITKYSTMPDNFTLLLSDGCSIPVPDQSIDFIFSHQLMEHLHPDDVLEQLTNIYNALRYGGVYFCITPNRLVGPCDISKYFDTVATGLHLKEYTNTEIEKLFKKAGFSTITLLYYIKRKTIMLPFVMAKYLENILDLLPFLLRRKIARFAPIHAMLGISVVAKK